MKPLVLIVLDGWGLREGIEHNAVKLANLSHFNHWLADYPHTTLAASGEAVGLMSGIMGNSEVGHMNIGAGRIVYQDLTRISQAIADGSFFKNEVLLSAMGVCRQNRSALHLMGLLSDAGVHSHIQHLFALLHLAREQGLTKVYLHAFMDGRDTPPNSGARYQKELEAKMREMGVGELATLSGRYYAMDRDRRWDRTEKAWQAIVCGEGERTEKAPDQVLQDWYDNKKAMPGYGDEFLPPTVLIDPISKNPRGMIKDKDAVVFFNFRPDRARQLTQVLTDPDFGEFERLPYPQLARYVCMTPYNKDFDLPVAFEKQHLERILPEVLAEHGLKQYRVAETEKYAHVTYFFNGGEERIFPGEERKLIPSNREVGTYDLAPQMRAPEIANEVLRSLKKGEHDFYVVNFANPDMVGHTGNESAVVRALEVVDHCLGQIAAAVFKKGGTLLITADHGNCEEMVDQNGVIHTQHTLNPVPLLVIGEEVKGLKVRPGKLCDVAPTILELLKLEQPKEMTGESLCHPLIS